MSPAGRWHLTFASIETAFVLWFLYMCLFLRDDSAEIDREESLRAWRFFIGYSTLIVGDFVIWKLVIAPESKFMASDVLALSPFPLSLIVYLMLRKRSDTVARRES